MIPVDYAALSERTCSVCKQTKPVSEFNRYNDPTAVLTGWRYYSRCIQCNRDKCRDYGQRSKEKRNERLRWWRAQNPEKASALDRRKRLAKYGLTEYEAAALLAANDGRCIICDDANAVAIDHCHKSGRVRGGLCLSCNTLLGRVESNPKILQRMASYAGLDLPMPCRYIA